MTREIDLPRFKRYLTREGRSANARERRDRNRAHGLCINENLQGNHGPATHGTRCERCHETHKRTR